MQKVQLSFSVPWKKESDTGFEQHEGELIMTEFKNLGEHFF